MADRVEVRSFDLATLDWWDLLSGADLVVSTLCLHHRGSPQRSRHGRRRHFKGTQVAAECTHLDLIRVTLPTKHVCEDCVRIGATWVHLRMCLICGHIACCDDSPNRHATAHFHSTKHPLVRSIEPGETWTWCYADDLSPGELKE
jgi:hypothetical protein